MATATKEPAAPSQAVSEDESLKTNTDCVYFLASPLTCKKGSECEYRHSEYARVNPRDCWYWLNGSCLNPKCAFRHPPLEGLMGPQPGNFAGPSLPVPPAPPVSSAPHIVAKQAVPCIFFQKGYCLKGDICPFLHGPNLHNTKTQQVPPAVPLATEVPNPFKGFGGLEKCTQPKMNFLATSSKVVGAPPQAPSVPKVETVLPRKGVPARKRGPPPSGLNEEPPKYKERTASAENGNSRSSSARAHHASSLDDPDFQNGRDADDSLRESSPGFDVLVDDKLRDDEYYHNKDQYARMTGHDGRSRNEFEIGHQNDYNPVANDPEIYHNRRGYDSYDRLPERNAWEQRRASERSVGEPAHHDRRRSYKSESPDFVQNSDLRQRLSKQRRLNGLKSVVNPDYNPDNRVDDRGHRSNRRESRRSPARESSLSSRLQGRIKLPRRSPPGSFDSIHSERQSGKGRNWGRSSPTRPQVSHHEGRLRDRLHGRVQDDGHEGRSLRGPAIRRDLSQDNNGTNFAGPKSLAELKGPKRPDNKEHQLRQQKGQQSVSGGKLRDTVLASSLGTEGDISFEGPKPLSEILKRKKEAGNSGNNEENNQNENMITSTVNSAGYSEKRVAPSSAPEQEEAGDEVNKCATAEGDEEEGEISSKRVKLVEDESLSNDAKHLEAEDRLVAAEGEEHGVDEEYDHGDAQYEYEQDDDGEGYNLNDDETAEHEDFMDEDDGDDFAKKIGVSF